MRTYLLLVFTLISMSETASAITNNYIISGNLNQVYCADPGFDPKCGEFSVMFTIDDTQTPTIDFGWHYYNLDAMATLADGTVVDGGNSQLAVRTNPGIEQLAGFTVYAPGGTILLDLSWIFPDNTFDLTDIGEILGAMETGPATQTYSRLESIYGNCGHDSNCEGTVGLIEPKVIPIPAAIWMFGSGLLGLLGVSRKKKAAQ